MMVTYKVSVGKQVNCLWICRQLIVSNMTLDPFWSTCFGSTREESDLECYLPILSLYSFRCKSGFIFSTLSVTEFCY